MESALDSYINRKIQSIEVKVNLISKVALCQSLKEYFEKFCSRQDNPTFNLIEVEMKRTLHNA